MNPDFKTIALIGKHNTGTGAQSLARLGHFLASRGHEVFIAAHTADMCQISDFPVAPLKTICKRANLAIVMGGDGTLLNIARTLVDDRVPLIGINQGRLGFLADVSIDTMFSTLEDMLEGQYVAEERLLLDASVERHDDLLIAAYAFNDVVVNKSVTGRLIEFEVYIDSQFVYSQRADGLVVSSPTGSTAYSLSAGGPILHPTLEAFTMVPICPHTLSARAIAVNSRSDVEINLIHGDDARVHFDGQEHADLKVGDRVVVRRARNTIRLLHPEGHNYFDTLREKLHWGEKL